METSNGKFVGVAAVAIAIVALAFSIFGGAQAPAGQNVGGERAGLQEFIDGIKAGDLNMKWASAKLPPQATSVQVYCNRTGQDVLSDFGSAVVLTGETASSTTKFSIFATTSTSIATWVDFGTLAEGKRALIQALGIATSTTASTTNSVYAAVQGKGNGAILIPTGSCVYGVLQQDTTACSIAGAANGAACETATSTNRGFNPIFNVRVHSSRAGAPSL
jgi:hypothetical protein